MTKLLFITTNLQGSGGVSRVLSVKLNYLIQTFGYNIHVITTNNRFDTFFYEYNKKIVFHKIDIKSFGFCYFFKYKRRLQNIVNNVEPDFIINCDNGFKGNLLPYIVKSKALLIYERHCSRKISSSKLKESIKNRVANFILDRSFKYYGVFVVLNHEDKNDWKTNNIKVIPNPLCLKPPLKKLQEKNKIALAVGRQSIEKQYDVLLKIWQKVAVDYPDWTLKIYGESDKDNSLIKFAERLKLEKYVEFYPPTKNISEVYQNASMLLNTSSSEAFGLVIIEAMAYGLPVIAFNNASGPKVLIENDLNGFLITNYDIDAYTSKIELLIKDEVLRGKLSKNAKETARKFDIEVVMKQWHELFESLK